MKPVKVLIVDDSNFARAFIKELLVNAPYIRVVGEAVNGIEALEKIKSFKPDIVTLDIDMPLMNGLEVVEKVMSSPLALPILIVTSRADAQTAFQAISKGALEVLPKPDLDYMHSNEFINKIKLLSRVKVITHLRQSRKAVKPVLSQKRMNIVAIASSTGGPQALSVLLADLPQNLPVPIVVAQHIVEDFIPGMVRWLDSLTKLTVKIAEPREKLTAGQVYFSRTRWNMSIDPQKRIVFKEPAPGNIYQPSCDHLLNSVAEIFGCSSIGVILSGMGNDGTAGIKKIKQAQGITIAQDQDTSAIFGMPKAAIESGFIDQVLPLTEIGGQIVKIL